jgi:CheY-like chemotaxis protein
VPTVALVEDNEDNRLVVQLLLSIRYEVRDCESDAEALAALAALAEADALPDVVLTDIDMPGMNGLEVLRRIRATPPRSRRSRWWRSPRTRCAATARSSSRRGSTAT